MPLAGAISSSPNEYISASYRGLAGRPRGSSGRRSHVKTAIISDLHLGVVSGGDVLRGPEIRAVLAAELRGADRLVLLGDALELRELPVGAALEQARPALEDLGAAVGDIEVVLVPGNHDARLAEPLLDGLSIDDAPLPLDATAG